MSTVSNRAHREAVIGIVRQLLAGIGYGFELGSEVEASEKARSRAETRRRRKLPPGDMTTAELAYEARMKRENGGAR